MLSALNAILICTSSLLAPPGAQTFSFADFSDVTDLYFVGEAHQTGNVLELMDGVAIAPPLTNGETRGAAWYANPVNVLNGFDTTFTYQTRSPSTTGTDDGFAFVIQTDPDADHISICTGGSGDNGTLDSFSIGRVNSAALGGDLNLSSAVRTVRVVYTPGSPGILDVYWEGALEISVPYDFASGGTWIDSATPVGGLNLIGGTSAYVGFTAGAATGSEFREVLTWNWISTGAPTSVPFCFGDGSASACPCGNSGATGNGCASSVNANGGNLSTLGNASLTSDTFILQGSGMPNSSALYFQGTTPMSGGPGTAFGDGLRCTGGTIVRLGTKSNASGASQYPGVGDTSVSARGLVTTAGTRTYQVWYRNAAAFCTASAFNLTNAVEVTWN